MYLSTILPLSLLLLIPVATPSQLPFDATLSTTVVTVLNNDPDYTSLLKLLQRAKLIPTLNKLSACTLFAPTNDAIDKHPLWRSALVDPALLSDPHDNIQEKLRQELFYHLLNYTLQPFPDEGNLEVHKTLLYPREPLQPPTNEPPPGPPWLPVPGGTLDGEPQRLRVASHKEGVRVGTDASGQGGAEVVKGQVEAGNGMVIGIGDVLQVPPDLASVAALHDSLSYFNKIITEQITQLLNSTPSLTLFLPVNAAWDVLPDIERKYLESEFATDDLLSILDMHAVVASGVHWSDEFEAAVNLTTLSGSTLEIIQSPETHKTLVSSAELVDADMYASNGVLHTVSSLLIPPDAFVPTPEKYLLTLECKSFVSLLHSVDLESLINNTEGSYTILAPRDDVLEMLGDEHDGLPEPGSEKLKRVLSYHFLPGKWTPKKLKDGLLVETLLEEEGLNGGRQVLTVEVTEEDGKQKKEKSIHFGGAAFMGEVYEVKDTLIYLISRPLTPPADVLETILPTLDFANFFAAVSSTSGFADMLKKAPGTTFLVPVNDGFKRLGTLVSTHLLSASSKTDLESVVLHHIIDGVEYSKGLANGSQLSYATLEGSDIHVDRSEPGVVTVRPSGGWAGMEAKATVRNMLTRTGVVHELSDVLLPRSLNLTIGKLVRAGKGTTMATILVRSGMDWILDGTPPPEGSPWAEAGLGDVGWTLICPMDDAFKGYNLTKLYQDTDLLQAIVDQHLIPVPTSHSSLPTKFDSFHTNKPLEIEDKATYTTLESKNSAYGDIVFRSSEGEKGEVVYLVGIKDARGTGADKDWATVLSWGRTTSYNGVGGVIQVDHLLIPYRPPWWLEYGAPLSVGGLGIIMIGIFFAGVRAFWRRDTTEATYEPVGGFNNVDDSD